MPGGRLEFLQLNSENKQPTVGLVCAAFCGGQPRDGVETAPQALLDAGLVQQLKELGWNVEFDNLVQDFENLKRTSDMPLGLLKKPRMCGSACRSVADQCAAFQKQGYLSLLLGGDHSLGLGSIAATARAHSDFGVIWVDAHADINTPETTVTGNIHGMPLSWVFGIAGKVAGFEWVSDTPMLRPDQLVYIGLRDVDPCEKKLLKTLGIKAFSMHEVDKYGIGTVMDMALKHIDPEGKKPIHLSFDVDALDPSVAPSTGTPVRGGLTFREGHYICEEVFNTGRLVAMDLMEVNPMLGDDTMRQQTTMIGCSLVRCALGETLL